MRWRLPHLLLCVPAPLSPPAPFFFLLPQSVVPPSPFPSRPSPIQMTCLLSLFSFVASLRDKKHIMRAKRGSERTLCICRPPPPSLSLPPSPDSSSPPLPTHMPRRAPLLAPPPLLTNKTVLAPRFLFLAKSRRWPPLVNLFNPLHSCAQEVGSDDRYSATLHRQAAVTCQPTAAETHHTGQGHTLVAKRRRCRVSAVSLPPSLLLPPSSRHSAITIAIIIIIIVRSFTAAAAAARRRSRRSGT